MSERQSPILSSPSRISVFKAWIRRIAGTVLAKFKCFNPWIASKFHISRERIVQLELGGLFALGFTLMQIGEWAAAIACWVLLACIFFDKVMKWEGVKGQKGLTAFLKFFSTVGVVLGCVVFITITERRKPEDEPWSNLLKSPCTVSFDIHSEIIARVHSRAMWLASGNTEPYKPIFQDLFHDWVIKATPTRAASRVIISIQDAHKPLGNIQVEPSENVAISEPKAGWISGFEEPTQTPDFYVRTVSFATLNEPTTITIRQPIKSRIGVNTITPLDLDLDRQIKVWAEKCKIIFSPLPTTEARFRVLGDQLQAMLAQKVVGPVTTRLDPDEPYPPLAVKESELIEELRCSNFSCTALTVTMKEKTRVQ